MRKFLLTTALTLISVSGFSVPAKRGFQSYQQPDGSVITLTLEGDEFTHYYQTTDGQYILQDQEGYFRYAINQNGAMISGSVKAHDPENRSESEKEYILQIEPTAFTDIIPELRARNIERRNSNIQKAMNFPSTGEVHGLVLLVEFSNKRFSTSNPLNMFTNLTNQENCTIGGMTGSVRDYFISQSRGTFTPKFDVYGPITLSKNMEAYGGNLNGQDKDPAGMVKDACILANTDFGVDFSNYDYDGDGQVDLIYVIYAGYAESQNGGANTIWPHAWSLTSAGYNLKLDNKWISDYACSSELSGNSGSNLDGIGTFCHEFSHCLGLPDLYDTNNSGNIFGMDQWDVMDYGSYNNGSKTPAGYSAFEKASVGWLKLQELINPGEITLSNLAESNEACAIYSDVNRNEYFILENRQQTGWDKYLPNAGLLITHIDYLQSAWDRNIVNNTYGHQRVSVVPADNKLVVPTGSNYTTYIQSLKGDIYPGTSENRSFTDISTPAASLYTNGKLGKPVTNISHENGIISFSFLENVVLSPAILPASDITHNSFTANWGTVEGATSYSLKVAEYKPATEILAESFEKFTAGSLTSPSSSDISSKLDSYMSTTGWKGAKIYQAGKYCKLGSNSANGKLISPSLDLSEAMGTITIFYTIHSKSSYTGGVVLSLTSDSAGENKITSGTDNLSSTSTRKRMVLKNVPDNAYFKINTYTTSYLKDLMIYTGEIDEEPTLQKSSTTFEPLLFENLSGNSYRVANLNPETSYSYWVKAIKDSNESEWSKAAIAVTDIASGITSITDNSNIRIIGNKICISSNPGTTIRIFDISGRCLYTEITTQPETTIMFPDGIYLVKTGDATHKIVIR